MPIWEHKRNTHLSASFKINIDSLILYIIGIDAKISIGGYCYGTKQEIKAFYLLLTSRQS
jgi:hypothetical protein